MDPSKKHPRGLYVLFGTEAGERFSYYGTRSILVLFMIFLFKAEPDQIFGFTLIKSLLEGIFGDLSDQALSSQIYGIYSALCYLTPVIGGLIADKYLGQRKSVVVGGLVMAAGHFTLMMPQYFFVGIILLVLGNGMFKPNISTQVGGLYPDKKDPRRDRAFNIFYMGINLGAVFSPLICGTLGQKVGWSWGFASAGIAMCLSTVLYALMQKTLPTDNITKTRAGVVKHEALTKKDWTKIWALVALSTLNIPFWAIYEQQGNTMQLWADQKTIWPTLTMSWPVAFSWQVPSTWYQAFNPMMIFIGTPIILGFWGWQNKRNREPATINKMAIGCFLLGSSFIMMILGSHFVGDGKGSLFWPLSCTLVLTIGELYLSPMGLSLVTKIAPVRVISMMMGIWFTSSFFGNYLSGFIGSYYERMSHDVFFAMLTAIGIMAGLCMWAFSSSIKKAMQEEPPTSE